MRDRNGYTRRKHVTQSVIAGANVAMHPSGQDGVCRVTGRAERNGSSKVRHPAVECVKRGDGDREGHARCLRRRNLVPCKMVEFAWYVVVVDYGRAALAIANDGIHGDVE